jgi:hypothetical protein
MDMDGEIVVQIEEETPEPKEAASVVVVDDTKKTVSADDPIETLKSQLAARQSEVEAANQRATQAETAAQQSTQRARQAEQDAELARTQAAESTKSTIQSGIAAAKAEADSAKQAYKAAFESGDADKVADAQFRLAGAVADLRMLEQAQSDIQEAPPKRQEPRQPPQEDPIEAFINQRTAPTAKWLREHRDYLTDPKKNAKMQAAHFDALGSDIPVDSPQYFDHVERYLGMKTETPAPKPNGAEPSQRRPTAPVAPVTASGGGMSGGAVTVKLTRGEADAATDGTLQWNYDDPSGKGRFKKGDPIGIQEMARRKAALTKDGRYQNANIDGT